jgi:Arc/MetJ-type ribon-helix-helix transcriptional regulator
MRTTIHLPDRMHDCLKRIAQTRRSTMSDLLREALERCHGDELAAVAAEIERLRKESGLRPMWSEDGRFRSVRLYGPTGPASGASSADTGA